MSREIKNRVERRCSLSIKDIMRSISIILFLTSIFLCSPLFAAITAVTSSASTTGTAGTINVTISSPAGTTTGDVLVLIVAEHQGAEVLTSVSDGSGHNFTADEFGAQNGSISTAVWHRVVGASDGTTWTLNGASKLEAALMAYRGVDNTTPIDATGTTSTGSTSPATFKSVTTVTNGAWFIGAFAASSTANPQMNVQTSGSPTLTKRADFQNGGATTTRACVSFLDGAVATHGATGDIVWSLTSAPVWGTYTFALRPGSTSSIALTGTITASATETDIVNGGKTIILTITGDTWVASGATFDAQRQNIIDGLTSAQSEAHGWNNEVKAKIGVSDVVQTSSTVVTITLDAEAGYNITVPETITATVPATALTGGSQIVATPTFTITQVSSTKGNLFLTM